MTDHLFAEGDLQAVARHPSCVREIHHGGEANFRFVLSHRDDPERELTLTILVFEVPSS